MASRKKTAYLSPRRIKIVSQIDLPIDRHEIRKLVKEVLSLMGILRWNLIFYFLDDKGIIEANKVVFSHNYPTDVISVPIEQDPLEGEVLLGIDEIKRNSEEYSTDFVWEIKFCLLHGLLHLLGWQDDTDEERKKMLEFQTKILNRYESGLPLKQL